MPLPKIQRPPSEVWKAVIVAVNETREQIDDTVIRLRHLGIESIHITAGPSVRVNKKWDIIVHQDKTWSNTYKLWRDTIQIFAKTFSNQADYFLLVRPGAWIWEQLPVYCELTIPPGLVGLWSPFTPNRVFPDESRQRPSCDGQFGWCPAYLNANFTAGYCYVATSHGLTLAAAYLPEEPSLGKNVTGSIGVALTKHQLPVYFHIPSLIAYPAPNCLSDDFIGVSYEMSQTDMRNSNFILEPN